MTRLSLICSVAGIAVLYVGGALMRPTLTPIAEVDNDSVGLKVMVSGRVTDLYEHPDGHLFLKIEDGSGDTISVPIFSRTRSDLGEQVRMLDRVQVVGEVELYNGTLEVVPGGAEDVSVVHTAPADVSEIDQNRLGKLVKVKGIVAFREEIGSGNLILILEGGGSRLKTFVPASVARKEGFPEVGVGDVVTVCGEIQMYRGELELEVKDAGNLEVLEASG